MSNESSGILYEGDGEDDTGHPITIEWYVPQDMTSRYATNFIIQHSPREFFLSFFEIEPPIILGSPEERVNHAKGITSIRAKCVSRIALTPERMRELIDILIENYEGYESKMGGKGDEA
jgi:hypothetical protein